YDHSAGPGCTVCGADYRGGHVPVAENKLTARIRGHFSFLATRAVHEIFTNTRIPDLSPPGRMVGQLLAVVLHKPHFQGISVYRYFK
ncbi:MAG: hypothetical protein D6732_00755, partial [Methanobacteriota archaeon]